MQNLGLNEIREKFLAFYESKGHLRMASFPLVPQNDASLLLINAGMAPLKPYFTGKETPPKNRITTCQKCIRTPDIEQVGQTARHGTFFEMLGNFSFGDYFKMDATKWAWEFSTEVMELPKDRIWISVYEGDEESADIWVNHVGVSRDRIVYMGKEDNFWEIGIGPCGPCSELYFDRGEEFGCGSPDCKVGCECDRFVEFWNLVFTQFDKDESGTYNKLAHPNIDTGMGLERIACIMQGTTSIFEVDTIRKVLDAAADIAGVQYGKDANVDTSLRVITDHVRSTVFLVSDGVLPSKEGRGYVLRRLLRRAARHGKMLGIKEMFLYKLARVVANESMSAYPELDQNFEYIENVIRSEEARFDETIDQGISILNGYIEEMKRNGDEILDGEKVFKLYDTYGFPIDLTKEIVGENGYAVATQMFNDLLNQQRERARSARGNMEDAAWEDDVFKDVDNSSVFDGYKKLEGSSNVLAISKGNVLAENAESGDEVFILLDRTTFYAESGGQVGDTGYIENDNVSIKVIDTKMSNGKSLHKCIVENGVITVGDGVKTVVDYERRQAIKRNHTAVHMVQAALKEVLGNHVAQAGSYVDEYRFRFDFSHFQALSEEEIVKVGMIVNKMIMETIPVETFEKNIAAAKSMGAIALFSEKYGDKVRVVKIDDFSIELCGGCHVTNTGKLGLMKILTETGVAAGVRRIEGVTGFNVLTQMREKEDIIIGVSSVLKTNPNDLLSRVEGVNSELREAKREIDSLKSKLAKNSIDDVVSESELINGISLMAKVLDDNIDMNTMREIGDNIKQKLPNAFVVLASKMDDKVNLVSMASKEAMDLGAHAGKIISEVAKQLGGGGGGKPDSAQAGGKNPEKTDEVIKKVSEILKKYQEQK